MHLSSYKDRNVTQEIRKIIQEEKMSIYDEAKKLKEKTLEDFIQKGFTRYLNDKLRRNIEKWVEDFEGNNVEHMIDVWIRDEVEADKFRDVCRAEIIKTLNRKI